MDAFGIYQATKAMLNIYFQSSRSSGRTQSMIDGLKEGDTVCFTNRKEAIRVMELCRQRGFEINTEVIDPNKPEHVFERPPSKGRYIFDHSWVEEYYLRAIENANKDIAYFQKNKSGFGSPHFETKRKAAEISKWQHSQFI